MCTTYYIGVDGSGPSLAALAWGVQRASERNIPIVLVHVVDDEWRSDEYAGAAHDAELQILDEALREVQDRVLDVECGMRKATRDQSILGSVAHDVRMNINAPVLVARTEVL